MTEDIGAIPLGPPYASLSLGPSIHLRCYNESQGQNRWEFVHVSKQGKARHYDLPYLGTDAILHGDDTGSQLHSIAVRHGKELKTVLLLVLSVAKDPGYYGISSEDWARAADTEPNGWALIMDKIARLQGRAVGRVKALMTEEDWNTVQKSLLTVPELRKILVGLAQPPRRGETLSIWLPADLVQELHAESDKTGVKLSRIVLEALQNRYAK